MHRLLPTLLLTACTTQPAAVDPSKALDATELTRIAAGLAPGHPYACDITPAVFGDDEAMLTRCEGLNIPGVIVSAVVDHKVHHLTLSRPGVPAGIELLDVTGDDVPEALITIGGGGTLEHALRLIVVQWHGGAFRRLGETTLRRTPIDDDEDGATAFVASGLPLCIAPAIPPDALYARPTTALAPGQQWVFDDVSDEMVFRGTCQG